MPGLAEITRWCVQVLGLALGYFLVGQLGLLQAIQPGYATAIWPASGIALAGVLLFGNRVWPGVLLGSFAVNVPTTFDAETLLAAMISLAVPLGIGCGAALQATLGAVMVRRFLGFPNPLHREWDVAKLILFVIPVSCLLGATTGVGLLWWSDRIGSEECAFNWWTWYLGDVIGVLVVAPLALLWTAAQPDWPRRPISVTVPVSVVAVLVVVMFIYTKHREEERLKSTFELHAESLKRAIEARMDSSIEALNGMKYFYGQYPNQDDQGRFTRIAERTLKRRGDTVEALSWLPRVLDKDRPKFEAAGRALYTQRFCIKERDEAKQVVQAAARTEYFPLLYRSPDPESTDAWGFDIASQVERSEVLLHAAKTAEPIASPPLAPLQKTPGGKLVLIYLPIYRDGVAPDSEADRRDELLGFIVAILRVDRLAKSAWETIDKQGIDITLLADSTANGEELVYYHLPAQGIAPGQRHSATPHRVSFRAAGRKWTLACAQTRQFQNAHRSMQAWSVLSLGALATGLLGGILLVVTGRTAFITLLVEQRTAELERTNATLVQQIQERLRVEEELRKSREESRLIIDTAADAFIAMDAQGIVTAWNRQAERSLGWSHAEALGRPLAELILPAPCRHAVVDIMRKFGNGEELASSKPIELTAKARDGREFLVEWTIWPAPAGQNLSFNSFVRDITERKRAEEVLRKSEAALLESRHLVDRIAEMMPSILYVYDLHQHCYIFVNNRIQSILGYDPQEVKQPHAALLFENYHPDDLPTMEWVNEQYQTAEDDAVIETEYRMRHSNGEWRWLHTYNTIFVRDANGEPRQILGTAQDITERKRLEQEVLDIAAQEQRRIGQELHDGSGQELTGLCMLADNLAETLLEDSRKEEQLARRIAEGLRHALMHVRGLSRGLIPVEVDAEGLMSSLSDLAARISELSGIRCVFDCAEPVPVEDNYTATQLYRIAQEAITNALRHGQASHIRVTLEARGYYLTLRVTDDGIGLPPVEVMGEGMGLRIMRYRAGQIGAQLSVRCGANGGTVVLCTLFRGTFHD